MKAVVFLEDVWKVKKSSSNDDLSVDKNTTALLGKYLNHIQGLIDFKHLLRAMNSNSVEIASQ
ncbi:MAG: hypothetical protein KAF91_09385 [Nostoc sp. TH1S01]|nr:hypothetical protein [Nostoc sp. TH1S01]